MVSWLYRAAIFVLIACSVLYSQGSVRIFVEPIAIKGGDIALRDALVQSLKKQKMIVLATSAAEADRTIEGFGETYIKGYLGRNHRVRYRNSDSRPIYGGYLSIELKDRSDETIWSNLVTPSRMGNQEIGKDLADQIVDRLISFLSKQQGAPKP